MMTIMMRIVPIAIALLNPVCIATNVSDILLQTAQELSDEELELLNEIDQDPAQLYKPLNDALESTRAELSRLTQMMEGESFQEVSERGNILMNQYDELARGTHEFGIQVDQYNEQSVADFVERVQNVIEEEFDRRARLPETDDDLTENVWPKKLEMKDIMREIDIDRLTGPSVEALGHHVVTSMSNKWHDMLADYFEKCQESVEEKGFAMKKELSQAARQEKTNCITAVDAANQILASMIQLDRDEKNTDLLAYATLTYGSEWTSDTYQPEIQSSYADARELSLGDPKVRKYIPEDWERLLPSGWKEWDISILTKLMTSPSPQNIVPPYIWHSLPAHLASIIESPFRKAVPARPETILDSNMHLGSCWKMAGSSGRVTLTLQKPAVIDSITIDHYPWIPSAHNPKEHMNQITSAPRVMRLQGYPSCDTNAECKEQHGFDTKHPIWYNSFEYEIDAALLDTDEFPDKRVPSSSSQTFKLSPATFLDEDADEDPAGGCSAVEPTCDGAPPLEVQAITLIIDSNWGHSDYTCVYRIRINEKKN
eukprot:scaffold4604_cov241-Chaetoceros_neogracile.AAC.2